MQAGGDDQHRIWILSGTGEGPPLTRTLVERGWRVQVSVVTDAAALAYKGIALDQIRIGALAGQAGMAAVLHASCCITTQSPCRVSPPKVTAVSSPAWFLVGVNTGLAITWRSKPSSCSHWV